MDSSGCSLTVVPALEVSGLSAVLRGSPNGSPVGVGSSGSLSGRGAVEGGIVSGVSLGLLDALAL